MAGKIEIRASGDKFRFVVLNRSGDKLMQSGQYNDKPSAKRAATALGRALSGAEIVDATKPANAPVKTTSAAKPAPVKPTPAVAKTSAERAAKR